MIVSSICLISSTRSSPPVATLRHIVSTTSGWRSTAWSSSKMPHASLQSATADPSQSDHRLVLRRAGELRQPRVADAIDRFPQPRPLLVVQLGKEPREVQLVTSAQVLRLIEEQHLGRCGWYAPWRLCDGAWHRHADQGIARNDPFAGRAVANLDVQPEAILRT